MYLMEKIMEGIPTKEVYYTDTLIDLYPELLDEHVHSYRIVEKTENPATMGISLLIKCSCCDSSFVKSLSHQDIIEIY
jgi:hypothetical protein